MEELINKEFTGIYSLIIHEGDIKIPLLDSLVLQGSVEFQLHTQQSKLSVWNVIEGDYIVDGEFESEEISLNVVLDKSFTIENIIVYYDDSESYELGLILETNDLNIYILRLADELELVEKARFDSAFEITKHILREVDLSDI